MGKIPNKYPVLFVYVVLTAATFIAFEQVRRCQFVDYDDYGYVLENPHVQHGITRQSVFWAFTTMHKANWHPLTWFSHMLDCQLFGLNPHWHHLTGLLFHIANTLLLFCILRKMTGALWRSAFVAALFALHPLHVESVAWISERKDVLSTLFCFLTIGAYLHYVKRPSVSRYLLPLILFALGLMAKPMLVTLPFVLLLLDYWPLERFQLQRPYIIRLISEKIPFFVLSAASSVATFFVQQGGGAVATVDLIPFDFRIANALISYITYISKIIYPSHLAVLYPRPVYIPVWLPIGCFIILAAITAVIVYAAHRRRYLTVGWLWYLGTLVPVIGLVQVGDHAFADRYTYLPSIGIFIIITWGVVELTSRWRHQKLVMVTSAVTVLAVLLVCTRLQVRYWQNNLTLFGHAAGVTRNNYKMHNNYGLALYQNGQTDQAVVHFRESVRINPRHPPAQNNLGMALLGQEKFDEAAVHFNEAIRLEPDYLNAINNLGVVLEKQGKYDLAIQNYERILQLDPGYYYAHCGIGLVMAKQGRYDDAIKYFKNALQIKPDLPEVYYYLGQVYAQQDKYDSAIQNYNEALRLKPDWPTLHYELAAIYHKQGNFNFVVQYCTSALQLKPDFVEARINLARALFKLGEIQSAVEQYYQVLQFEPDRIDALSHLAWILAAAKNAKIRNSADAVKFAEHACRLTDYKDPLVVDTLAAAYAAAGDFAKAGTTAEKALELARSYEQKQLAGQIQNRLGLYKEGKPYIEP